MNLKICQHVRGSSFLEKKRHAMTSCRLLKNLLKIIFIHVRSFDLHFFWCCFARLRQEPQSRTSRDNNLIYLRRQSSFLIVDSSFNHSYFEGRLLGLFSSIWVAPLHGQKSTRFFIGSFQIPIWFRFHFRNILPHGSHVAGRLLSKNSTLKLAEARLFVNGRNGRLSFYVKSWTKLIQKQVS